MHKYVGSMKEVTKEEFEKFIKEYPRKLSSKDINFTTPSSTIYCDFELHPEMDSGLERIAASMVAEHVHECEHYSLNNAYYIKN